MTTTSNYPEWVDETERHIIDKLIDTILGAGHMIMVYDPEEGPSNRLDDKAAIQAEVGATDETTFKVYRETDGVYKGRIILIHGNGTDVISDHTDSPFMYAMVQPAQDLADKLSEEGL